MKAENIFVCSLWALRHLDAITEHFLLSPEGFSSAVLLDLHSLYSIFFFNIQSSSMLTVLFTLFSISEHMIA